MNSFRGGAVAGGVVVLVLVLVGLALLQRGRDSEGGDDGPIVVADVQLRAIQRSVYDVAGKAIELDVAFEPKEVKGPRIECIADNGAGAMLYADSAWTILGDGQARKRIDMQEAAPGDYSIRCASGDTEARAVASVPAATTPTTSTRPPQ